MLSDEITIQANGQSRQVRLPCSVSDFLSSCGWKPTQVVVEYNGSILPRDRLQDVLLRAGDRLEIIIPVAGG